MPGWTAGRDEGGGGGPWAPRHEAGSQACRHPASAEQLPLPACLRPCPEQQGYRRSKAKAAQPSPPTFGHRCDAAGKGLQLFCQRVVQKHVGHGLQAGRDAQRRQAEQRRQVHDRRRSAAASLRAAACVAEGARWLADLMPEAGWAEGLHLVVSLVVRSKEDGGVLQAGGQGRQAGGQAVKQAAAWGHVACCCRQQGGAWHWLPMQHSLRRVQ